MANLGSSWLPGSLIAGCGIPLNDRGEPLSIASRRASRLRVLPKKLPSTAIL